MTIYDGSWSSVVSRSIPPKNHPNTVGWFEFQQPLDSNFSTGLYSVLITYSNAGTAYSDLQQFEVVAGGNVKGAYDSLFFADQPQGDYILGRTDQGTSESRKGPYLG